MKKLTIKNLLLAAGVQDGGTSPANSDRIRWEPDTRPLELLIDDQLFDRVSFNAEGLGPMGCDIARRGEFTV